MRRGFEQADAAALHLMIVERAAKPTLVNLPEVRDLSLITGLSMLVPMTFFASFAGASPAMTASMGVSILALVATAVQVLRKEYGVTFRLSPFASSRATRRQAVPPRIVPSSHQSLTPSAKFSLTSRPMRRGR